MFLKPGLKPDLLEADIRQFSPGYTTIRCHLFEILTKIHSQNFPLLIKRTFRKDRKTQTKTVINLFMVNAKFS